MNCNGIHIYPDKVYIMFNMNINWPSVPVEKLREETLKEQDLEYDFDIIFGGRQFTYRSVTYHLYFQK